MRLNKWVVAVLVGVMVVGSTALVLRPSGAVQALSMPVEDAIPDVLEQVYSAFALDDEAEIYDALANAAVGDLVNTLYLQRRVAQVADHAEDGDALILGVEVFEITPLDSGSNFSVAWRVVGRVSHTSHVHERINLYAADLTMTDSDGAWKLSAFALKQNTRADDLTFVGGE